MIGVNPVSTLINGLGRYTGGPSSDLAVINVEYGKRYRFRLVGMSCDPNFTFSIDGHNLTVIEADGKLTEPLLVDSLQVFAGQRYSVIMNATQPVGNYWIRALPSTTAPTFAGGLNSAILRYSGASTQYPTTNYTPGVIPLQEQNLHALINPGAPGIPEYGKADINIDISANNVGGVFYMNDVRYRPPTVPVLLQILSGAQQATDLLPNGSVYVLEPNKVVELTVQTIGFGGPVSSLNSSPFSNYLHVFSTQSISTGFVHRRGNIPTTNLVYSMLSTLFKAQVSQPSTTRTRFVETWPPLAYKGNKWLFDL